MPPNGGFVMAYNLNLSNEQRYIKLANSTSQTTKRLSDQLVFKLGTTRKSELVGKIGNNGKPHQEILNDYILSL